MWVWYERKSLRSLGNNTTNRIEALNRALKALFRAVKRTRMDFADCVESLLKFLTLNDTSIQYSEYLNTEKTPYANHPVYGAVLSDYGKLLTKKALKLICFQLIEYDAEKASYRIQNLDHNSYVVKNCKTENTHTLQMEPVSKEEQNVTGCQEMFVCSCFFNSAFGLLCQHILHVRSTLQSEEKLLTNCISRWYRAYQGVVCDFLPAATMDLLVSHANDDDVEEFAEASRYDTMPRERRYTIALLEAKKLCNIIAEFAGATFDRNDVELGTEELFVISDETSHPQRGDWILYFHLTHP